MEWPYADPPKQVDDLFAAGYLSSRFASVGEWMWALLEGLERETRQIGRRNVINIIIILIHVFMISFIY